MRHITIIVMLAVASTSGAQEFYSSSHMDPQAFYSSSHMDPQARAQTRVILEALAQVQTDSGRVAWQSKGLSKEDLRALIAHAKQSESQLDLLAKQAQGRICAKKEEYQGDRFGLAAVLDAEGEALERARFMIALRVISLEYEVPGPGGAMIRHSLFTRRINIPAHPGSYGHLIRVGYLSTARFLAVYCAES